MKVVPDTYQAYVRVVPDTYQAYVRVFPDTYQGCVRTIPDTYQGYVRVDPDTYQGYVGVVPGVVVDERRPVGHACYLVPVIPPGHDARVLVCVLTQPVVSLPEVVKDVPSTVGETSC